jgi:DNA polymerase III epsilon subunit-like protein
LTATRCIVLCLLDVDRQRLHTFADRAGADPISLGVELLQLTDGLVVVQSLYALRTLQALYGLQIDPSRVIDTLAIAKRLKPDQGHGLNAWANRFGAPRSKFRGSPVWTATAQRHCQQDAALVAAIYAHLLAHEVTV